MTLLFELLLDVAIQIGMEILVEFGWAGVKGALGRENHHPAVAAAGLAVLGAGLGGASLWLFPTSLVGPGPVPGASLLLAPLAAGAVMHAWGQYRRGRGHPTTNLATFAGGAAFAFGTALVRFLGAR